MRTQLLAFIGASVLAPGVALACGGFFCSNTPIDQSAERIVFAVNDATSEVTMHVQITYQGEAEDFAWIVPVPNVPDLFLSTDALFSTLAGTTQPYFYLNWVEEGTCTWGNQCGWGYCDYLDAEAGAGGPSRDEDGGGVQVIAQEAIGDYDTVTLQASSSAELLDWLQTSNYQLPDALSLVLDPYVSQDAYFVAIKLQNGKDTGDIAPLGLTYVGGLPSIPIQLTSIAATPDMRLEVYVFSDERAVPDNYLHVQINEAAIDWLSYGNNYDFVITLAADEAGGHAFATDFAGTTASMQGMLFTSGQYDVDALRGLDPVEFVNSLLNQGFPRTAKMQNLLREYIPMPADAVAAGIDERDFYNCLACYDEYVSQIAFDANAFADALLNEMLVPMEEAEQLFHDHPYLTRMTSSVSPEEMVVDPVFTFNASMGDVSNRHEADLVFECGGGLTYDQAPRRIELADGRIIRLPPSEWLIENGMTDSDFLDDLSIPAAARIEDTSANAGPVLLTDNTGLMQDQLDEHNARVDQTLSRGCSAVGGGGVWVLLLVLGMVTGRRRVR